MRWKTVPLLVLLFSATLYAVGLPNDFPPPEPPPPTPAPDEPTTSEIEDLVARVAQSQEQGIAASEKLREAAAGVLSRPAK